MVFHFLVVSLCNLFIMFGVDVGLTRRVHPRYLKHFVASLVGVSAGLALLIVFPALNHALEWQRHTSFMWTPIKIAVGLLMFDLFVYVVHRFVEHGVLWRWHRQHHTYVSDYELTYYTACQIGPQETAYYFGILLVICVTLGTNAFETAAILTWIMQQGAYMHHRGLPELPWPLMSCRQHRTHHFNARRYYGGLFLFWDKNDPIDSRAVRS